ncbi:aldehyde dehydrogenase family protein [Subtercola sp. YIM 133946]|uniref:aldehyde dehydrogenase family protein n=1 Tax=Subtercola sp. YIM 133946 TaxID=3118909 RepID=UPI002F959D92
MLETTAPSIPGSDAPAVGEYERNLKRVSTLLDRNWRMLIDGELVDATGEATFQISSPATEQVIARAPRASGDDVERAVAAAVRAFPAWSQVDPTERAERVRRIGDIIEEHKSDLALLDAVDGGAPIGVMASDVEHSARVCRYFAGLALEMKGYSLPVSTGTHFTVREPFGVVAAIVPFNHPILFAVTKLAAPLVAGNCVILKPADVTPLSALYLAELIATLFPPGVVQILTSEGPDVPRALVRHSDVARIAFTGSEKTGRSILRDAADTGVKEVTLELGGKNALIAYPDADPVEVGSAAVRGMNFAWSGQSCGSTSRLLVHDSIADDVITTIRRSLQGRKIGSPLDPASAQGPLVNGLQYTRVLDYIQSAQADGAEVVAGGGRPAGQPTGYFIEPTILDRVDKAARVATEEIFGPVLSIIRWSDSDDPVAIANSLPYGLTASVFTNDVRRALSVARALRAGYVWVNGVGQHFIGMPFGGYKSSGQGREESIEELLSYTETKSIHIVDQRR